MDSATVLNQTQDPFLQVFTVNLTNGNPFVFSLAELDAWYLDALYCTIQYASQLGASLLLLIVLILLTKSEKRTNILFLLNSMALVFNFLRLLLACCYFTGPFNEVYRIFAWDFSNLPTYAYSISITSEIFTVLLYVVIQISLLVQIQAVCIDLRKKYRLAIFVSSGVIGGATIAMRCYLAALNIQGILNPSTTATADLEIVSMDTDYLTTTTIFWFSAIFVAKLGYALYQRKKLGIRRWTSMQVIFIMGCQTMIIPAIFSIVQHSINFPAVSSFVLTLVALLLPLSSLWATTTLESKSISSSNLIATRQANPTYSDSSSKGRQESMAISLEGSIRYQNKNGSPTVEHSKEIETNMV